MSYPEAIIGLGVRSPLERADFVIAKFGILLETIHGLGAEAALVGYDSTSENPMLQQIGLNVDEATMTFGVSDRDISVDVIRDFTGGFSSQDVPMINEPEIRAATANKARLSEILGEDTFETHVLEPGTDLGSFLLNMNGDAFIVKPVTGRSSEGVEVITSPKDAAKSYADSMLIQPYADTTHMPDQLLGAGEYYKHLAALQGLPKEIRMYTYRTGDLPLQQVPILRVSRDPEMLKDDYFVIIDPETVPQEAYDVAERSVDALATSTGVPYLHGAVDMAWPDGVFKVMEINTKEPALPSIEIGYDGEDQLGASARVAMGHHTRQLLVKQHINVARKV